MMTILKAIVLGLKDAVMDVFFFPVVLLRLVGRGIRFVLRSIHRGFFSILHSPVGAYRRLVKIRDWVLAKIELAQSESAKWRALFTTAKLPYLALRAAGFSPQMAISLLLAGSAVSTGVVASQVLSEKSFMGGDPGVYAAPNDIPVFWAEGFNTLRISLSTVSVDAISLDAVSLGTIYAGSAIPSPATTVIDVGGGIAANSWIEVGTLTIDGLRCRTLLVQDVFAHTINITSNTADGLSVAPSPGAGASNRPRSVIAGNHGADALRSSGGTYDRLVIESLTAGTAYVSEISLSNILTRGATCRFQRMHIGELNIINSIIGNGDGLAAKDFLVATTVSGQVINVNNNIEVLTAEPAQINN
jgi:hypothetical protein